MTEEPAGWGDAATLSWGVKQSFRAYVEGSGGVIEAGEGATRTPDGAFAFPAAPGEGMRLDVDGKPEGVAKFAGAVRCEAHGGMLKVLFADPSVEIGPAGAAVFVADMQDRTRRIALATLDLAKATLGDDGAWVIPAKLARDGWQVLGDHYPQSTPLDPVRLTLAA